MGYTKVRDFDGGIAEWTEAGLPVESGDAGRSIANGQAVVPAAPARPAGADRTTKKKRKKLSPLPWIAKQSVGQLMGLWLTINLSFGVLYWSFSFLPGHGLRELGQPLGHGAAQLLEAIYFSFVTGLSIGFGDLVPNGILRVFSVIQGAACLLVFGAIISRMFSKRQEEMTAEIHRIAYEDRLGRVRTNLHLVVREMQEAVALCRSQSEAPDAVVTRVESVAAVFSGELHAIHDLLYRPQTAPAEDVLESILAHLEGGLREFANLLSCLSPEQRQSPALVTNVRSLAGLAEEICGECVPHEYAPHLKRWMDRVQGHARGISGART
jgi:potassium channel LctB